MNFKEMSTANHRILNAELDKVKAEIAFCTVRLNNENVAIAGKKAKLYNRQVSNDLALATVMVRYNNIQPGDQLDFDAINTDYGLAIDESASIKNDLADLANRSHHCSCIELTLAQAKAKARTVQYWIDFPF